MVAGAKLGNYELLAEIARGSTTDVLLARARGMAGFERHVVIKRVRDERAGDAAFTEAFITEARLAATLHHHNIVQVQDIAEADGIPYFAMEYVHGEDLRALLAHVHARRESIPIAHVLTIGLAVAGALHQAHERGIIHRDVTPANILVGYDGNVKVVDFGMAKAAITPGTQVGIKKGKAPYMAPEQCAGEKVDRRSDVFALGIVLYELLTARRLFKGTSDLDTMSTIVHGTIPSPHLHRADISPELASIIMKALARLPNDRYQSAADLAQAIETYTATAGVVGSASTLSSYLRMQLGERKEPWLADGSVRPTAPVDFDGNEPGIAVPAGDTTAQRLARAAAAAPAPAPASEDDDDDLVEESTVETTREQIATELKLPTRSSTATDVDLPLPPEVTKTDVMPAGLKAAVKDAAKPADNHAVKDAAKAIPSVTGKAPGTSAAGSASSKLGPGAFVPKATVPVPVAKATSVGVASPAARPMIPTPAVASPVLRMPESIAPIVTASPPVPASPSAVASPPVTKSPPVASPPPIASPSPASPPPVASPSLASPSPATTPAAPILPNAEPATDAAAAEKPNWDGISTNVPRLPPPPKVAPQIRRATPPATPKLEAAAAALDGKAGEPRARRGTAPITSDTSDNARGEILVDSKPFVKVVEGARRPGVDMTELVQPLPLDPAAAAAAERARKRRRLMFAAGGAAAVFVLIVVLIAFSGRSPVSSSASASGASANGTSANGASASDTSATAEPPNTATAPVASPQPQPAPTPAPAPAPSADTMTWNGVLDAGAAAAGSAAVAAPVATEPTAAAPATAEPATTEPATTEPATAEPATTEHATTEHAATEHATTEHAATEHAATEHATAHPASSIPHHVAAAPTPKHVAKPVAKPAAKPAKSNKPLKYDPNSLFLPK